MVESRLHPRPVPGDTLSVRLTVPVKPKLGLSTTGDCATEPASTVTEGELATRVKSRTM